MLRVQPSGFHEKLCCGILIGIHKNPIRNRQIHIGTVTLALMIGAVMFCGILVSGSSLRAADTGICGDGGIDPGEQCDDGNLVNGDGCSNTCTLEQCGNGVIDENEQCDAGGANGTKDSNCSLTCMISFCGDGMVDAGNGEECDDGNNVSGDGCSNVCTVENASSSSSASDSSASASTSASAQAEPEIVPTSEPPVTPVIPYHPAPPPPPPPVTYEAQTAKDAMQFLASPVGTEIQSYLTGTESQMLGTIFEKLARGEKLTATEREAAKSLSDKLEQTKTLQQAAYTNLLRSFVATAISSDVVTEQNMAKDRLSGADIQTAIGELSVKATVVPATEIPWTIVSEVAGLEKLGATVQGLPTDYTQKLSPDRSPLEIFSTLKSVKDATEKLATPDMKVSLASVQAQAATLKNALPDLEREYNLKPADLDPLLTTITTLAENGKPADREKLVNAVNRLTTILARAHVVSRQDMGGNNGQPLHAAASIEQLAKEFAPENTVMTQADAVDFVHTLAKEAPPEYKDAFATGTLTDQQQSLTTLLKSDPKTDAVLATLRADGRTDIDERMTTLTQDIQNIGNGQNTATLCDDSVSDSLKCVNSFLADVQEAARSRSVVTRTIGTLQDFFGIGSK